MIPVKYFELFKTLKSRIPEDRIYIDEFRRFAYGTDASFYRLIPKIVVKVSNKDEAKFVIDSCRKHDTPITFRAGGTSLSGQALSESVLMLIDRGWRDFKIKEDASAISMSPGLIGGHANFHLNKFNKRLGPDPASINSAMIGGIVSNNASGMTSGISANSYNTLTAIELIFADGSVLNTTQEASRRKFQDTHPDLISAIIDIANKIKENNNLRTRIANKFSIKNTTGYSLNAFVDFDDPIDIIARLIVGSEGTLAFISGVTLRTIENPPQKATALVFFSTIKDACAAIPILKGLPVNAAEIMDRQALKAVEDKEGMPDFIKTLPAKAAALLIETSAYSSEELNSHISLIATELSRTNVLKQMQFTNIPEEYEKLWSVRKGLFPSVCNSRQTGTSVIIEDVNFRTEDLAEAAVDLQNLFEQFGLENTIIFGHALSGNLHFVLTIDFGNPAEITRYKDFMDSLTKLVVEKYDGSLKAEHGTGRNIAPFVKYEWGEEIYSIMKRIKEIFDPLNLLNPGSLINEDENVHIKNLKLMPEVDETIDQCIECGFCEEVCPSKNLTFTPRQRITIYREIKRMEQSGNETERVADFLNKFEYFGNATCATDGLCEIKCPVNIDTGKFIKKLRSKKITTTSKFIANFVADNFSMVTSAGKVTLKTLEFKRKLTGEKFLFNSSRLLRKISNNKIPQWNKELPRASNFKILLANNEALNKKVVYFPSCINRTMGASPNAAGDKTVTDVMQSLFLKAGYRIIYPKNLSNLCCGMPFASKGLNYQAEKKSNELYMALMEASEGGKIPIVYDMSPCAKTSKENFRMKDGSLRIYDPVEFAHDILLNELKITRTNKEVTIFPVCSIVKTGIAEKLENIARKCSNNVVVPEIINCCGFAGDRGFTYPELNESSINYLTKGIKQDVKEGYSSSRTCEIGLSLHTGIEYKSILFLLDECSN